MAYFKGRGDEEKTTQNFIDHYEQRIKYLKDQIAEINNRPENWKNKIAESKETFKDA